LLASLQQAEMTGLWFGLSEAATSVDSSANLSVELSTWYITFTILVYLPRSRRLCRRVM